MGAWGPAVFSDDTAADIRADYRELLEDQVPDAEATQRVIADYEHLDAAQHQVGRLEDAVRDRALEVIDGRVGLELWEEAGAKELAKREAALAKLRGQLVEPQPARKNIRRPWRHVTDLTPGTVLAWTAPSGELALFRVVRINDHRVAASPILEVVGSLEPRAGDATVQPVFHTAWRGLLTSLQREFGTEPSP